ncbi:MAG: isopeptide-forming domain-containing fimbrial protein, partial [Vagococcus sp.]|nr:isopeptide-forming domain-containing fimbrial protein [Vagococcus sp.]
MKLSNIDKHFKILIIALSTVLLISQLSVKAQQGEGEFTQIFNEQMKGEIKITGNALQRPVEKVKNRKKYESNNDFVMRLLDTDDDVETQSSSSADLEINPGSMVKKAFLVWGASMRDKAIRKGQVCIAMKNPTIKFKTPNSNEYKEIEATEFYQLNNFNTKCDYSAYADVTTFVQQGGEGTYWAADIPQVTGYPDLHGGWALIVVFADESKPKNDLSVFFGHRIVKAPIDSLVEIKNIETPIEGDVHGKLGFIVWDGDAGYGGDSVKLDDIKLTDDVSPMDNFFNSAISNCGEHITNRNPQDTNNMSLDIKTINIDGILQNNQNNATLTFMTTEEWYYPTILTTEIEMNHPEITINKSVHSENKLEKTTEGDILIYTIYGENKGSSMKRDITITDILSEGLEYVKNSMQVRKNDVLESKTDEVDSDGASFDDEKGKITVSLAGLERNEQYEIQFKAKVTSEDFGKVIANQVDMSYRLTDAGEEISESALAEITTENPSISFKKSANKGASDRLSLGETIQYIFTIQNTGDVPVLEVTVDDPMVGLSPVILDKTEILPNEIITGTATYIVTQEDVDRGEIINTASVNAKTIGGNEISASSVLHLWTESNKADEPHPSEPYYPENNYTIFQTQPKKDIKEEAEVIVNPNVGLNRELHYAYMFGYPDRSFGPERPI